MDTLPNELVALILGCITDRDTLNNIASLGGRYYWIGKDRLDALEIHPKYLLIQVSGEWQYDPSLHIFHTKEDRDTWAKILTEYCKSCDTIMSIDLVGDDAPKLVDRKLVKEAEVVFDEWIPTKVDLSGDIPDDCGDLELYDKLGDVINKL